MTVVCKPLGRGNWSPMRLTYADWRALVQTADEALEVARKEGTAHDKADRIATARTLYPGLAETLRLAKHHNRAEALLLAHYGARKLA